MHERQVGAVDITIESHELRDHRQRARRRRRRDAPEGHRRARGGRSSKGRSGLPTRPARGRPDPAAVLRPVSRRGAARGRVGASAPSRAPAARRRRRVRRWPRARSSRRGAGGKASRARSAGAARRRASSRPWRCDVHVRIPDNLVVRGTEAAARRADAGRDRRASTSRVGGDLQRPQGAGRADHAAREP